MNRSLVFAFSLLALAGLSRSQSQASKPNFSGHWVMNSAQSKQLPFRGDDPEGTGPHVKGCCQTKTLVEIIDHKEPNITISVDDVEVDDKGKEYPIKLRWKLTTDNHENVNEQDGTEVYTTSHWEEGRLVTIETAEGGVKLVTVRYLSPDGRTLTQEHRARDSKGQLIAKLVLEKSGN